MPAKAPFARPVAGVLASRVARIGFAFVTSFLLAAMLLPEGRGQYALLVLLPGMLMALGQLGLPSAMSFFAGRGRSLAELQRLCLVLTAGLSVLLIGGTLLALPWLQATLLEPVPTDLLLVSLASVPFQLATALAGSTLIGRQRLRTYNLVVVAQSAFMLVGVVVLVGFLNLGVAGAAISYVTVAIMAAVATGIELHRAVGEDQVNGPPISIGQVAAYGIRIYPASVTGYFSYRADVLVLSALMGDAAAIGLYTFAVSLAELAFMVPDSVSTVFYPRVAGMERRDADALTPQVSRFTILVTLLAILALIPAGWIAATYIVPAYAASMAPFLVILPGIAALSISKVLASYITGLGMPLAVARASGANLVINLAANIALIPAFGIVGAALASLVSYVAHAAMLVMISARLGRRRPLEYVLPTSAEVRRLTAGVAGLMRSVGRSPPA